MRYFSLFRSFLWGCLVSASCGVQPEPCIPTCDHSCDGQPLRSDGVCPCGTVLYRIQSGVYNTESAQLDSDGCQLGATSQDLLVPRKVTNDTTNGTVTIASEDGSRVLGVGPILCNSAVFSYGPTAVSDGVCTWTVERRSQGYLSGDNRVQLSVSETRSNFASVAGMSCPRTTSCTIAYRLVLSMPLR